VIGLIAPITHGLPATLQLPEWIAVSLLIVVRFVSGIGVRTDPRVWPVTCRCGALARGNGAPGRLPRIKPSQLSWRRRARVPRANRPPSIML
jgi:hypothetical protein